MPLLIKKVLAAKGLSNTVCVDSIPPFRVGGFFGLFQNGFEPWRKKVKAAMLRNHAGGVLLILDGDVLTEKQSCTSCPIEVGPKAAKAWLNRHIDCGYKPTRDQLALTQLLTVDDLRSGGCRSFERLESAVDQLASAINTGVCVATPN